MLSVFETMHKLSWRACAWLSESNSVVSAFLSPLFRFCFFHVPALLAETERLGQERVDIQRQSDKDRVGLAARLRLLEVTLEEQETRVQQQEEKHHTQTEDLQQHIDALEKQLKHHRQFIDVCTSAVNQHLIGIWLVILSLWIQNVQRRL